MWCEKRRDLVCFFFPNGLIYGFQMVAGMFIWTLPKLPEPLGSANISLQISWEQNFFPGWGVEGGWLRFPVLPVLELLEMRQKLYFRISVPGPSWNLDTQMYTKKGHVCTHSHTHTHTHMRIYKGASYRLTKLFNVLNTHTQCFSIKKKNGVQLQNVS